MSSERKYLVIDTETSGLFDFSKPADADGQPRMASLAMIFLNAGLFTSTDIVKAPKKKGAGWKFPKLNEACSHFKIVNAGAHSALHDARACVEILRCLVALGECPEPAVYFAKERP